MRCGESRIRRRSTGYGMSHIGRGSRFRSCTLGPTPTRLQPSPACTNSPPTAATSSAASTTRSISAIRGARHPRSSERQQGSRLGHVPASAATTNLCAVLSARDAARGVLVLAAVPTAPSSCVLALNAPDSTSTPRTLVDTALSRPPSGSSSPTVRSSLRRRRARDPRP
jgi:hypothetical protein